MYIENRTSEQGSIAICDSKFYNNQAVSIYIANQQVYLFGKITFSNNLATNGSGIYITSHSTVTFGENSDIEFTDNRADYKSSAIFLQNYSTVSTVSFDQNSKVLFHDNKATSGSIYSKTSSNVIFKELVK